MNNPDQETVLRAVENARRILADYLEADHRDAKLTVDLLLVVLDRNDLLHTIQRMNRGRSMRLVDSPPLGT